MTQKVNVLLVDDIDGGHADETIQFGLDGFHYEIDLNSDHAQELRERKRLMQNPGNPVYAPPISGLSRRLATRGTK